MKLEIVVPTLGRPAQIARLVASIVAQGIECETRLLIESRPRPLWQPMNEYYRTTNADVSVFLADDCELLPGCLEAVARRFADGLDLMVGLNQTNIPPIHDCTEFAFYAVGSFWRYRYPDGELFCPDYTHFYMETEMGLYAKKIGRFAWAEDARIVHHHPSCSADTPDNTHRAARVNLANDIALFKARQSRGLLWGETFERLEA